MTGGPGRNGAAAAAGGAPAGGPGALGQGPGAPAGDPGALWGGPGAPGGDPGAPGGPGGGPGEPPGWLLDLAEAAASAPVPARLRPPPGGGRPSAVLMLFGTGPDGPDLLLVQRGPGLRRHSGQPAFPGGAIDPSDSGPVPAALREAAEEAGVDPAGVERAGRFAGCFH